MPPKSIPNTLPGTVLPQYVRCGNAGCHCARGELHGPYWYRFWREDGYTLRKEYVRKADLAAVRAACAQYAAEQREGRALLRQGQRLLPRLGDDDEPGRDVRQRLEDTLALPGIVEGLLDYGLGRKGDPGLQMRAAILLLRSYGPGARVQPEGYSHLQRQAS